MVGPEAVSQSDYEREAIHLYCGAHRTVCKRVVVQGDRIGEICDFNCSGEHLLNHVCDWEHYDVWIMKVSMALMSGVCVECFVCVCVCVCGCVCE
jgi:hypothetical protein